MSPRQVQVWFQNKRQRERKISRAKGMLSTPGLPDTPATQAAIAAARKERERSGSRPDDEEDDGLVLPPDGGSSGSGISTASSVPTASAGASKPAAPPAAGGGSGGSNGPTSLPPPIAGVPMSRTQSLDAGTALRSGLLGGGFGSIGGVSMERAQSLEGGQLDLGSTSLDLDRIDPLGLRQASAARNSARNSPRNSARTFRRKFSDALLLLSVSPSGERARCRRSRPRLAGGDGRRVRGGAVARPLWRVCR